MFFPRKFSAVIHEVVLASTEVHVIMYYTYI